MLWKRPWTKFSSDEHLWVAFENGTFLFEDGWVGGTWWVERTWIKYLHHPIYFTTKDEFSGRNRYIIYYVYSYLKKIHVIHDKQNLNPFSGYKVNNENNCTSLKSLLNWVRNSILNIHHRGVEVYRNYRIITGIA